MASVRSSTRSSPIGAARADAHAAEPELGSGALVADAKVHMHASRQTQDHHPSERVKELAVIGRPRAFSRTVRSRFPICSADRPAAAGGVSVPGDRRSLRPSRGRSQRDRRLRGNSLEAAGLVSHPRWRAGQLEVAYREARPSPTRGPSRRGAAPARRARRCSSPRSISASSRIACRLLLDRDQRRDLGAGPRRSAARTISKLLREDIRHHFASVILWDEQEGVLRRHALVFPERQRGHSRRRARRHGARRP